MELIFSSSALDAFNALTAAARGCEPTQMLSEAFKVGGIQLLEAAVRFTIQFAIAAAERDLDKARRTWDLVTGRQAAPSKPLRPSRVLEDELLGKLTTWRDEEGALVPRLWTHDISCVIGALVQAARNYAYPRQLSSGAAVLHAVETLPRNLAVAAVAFTIQLAIEETERDAVEMRALETGLISELEKPWGPLKVPLSVDVLEGLSWEELPEEV
jgi:hypothetical protein